MDSPVEILIVVALALLLFGPSRITSLARSLGEAMKEFKIGSDDTPTPAPQAPKAVTAEAFPPTPPSIVDADLPTGDPDLVEPPIAETAAGTDAVHADPTVTR